MDANDVSPWKKFDKTTLAHVLKTKWRCEGFETFTMKCVVCGVEKERTPEFWLMSSRYYLKHWEADACGKERLCNNKWQPCRSCDAIKCSIRRDTESGFISHCLSAARGRHNAKWKNTPFTLTAEVIQKMFEYQQGRCAKTRVPMILKANHNFRMSIDRIDNKKGYVEENIQLVVLEANVSGKEETCGQVSRYDYIRVFWSVRFWICRDLLLPTNSAEFEANWTNKACDNGVISKAGRAEYMRQMRDLHLPEILRCMACYHNVRDLQKNRPGRVTKDDLFLVLKQNDFRCYHSGLPLEFRANSRYKVSFDRIDLSKSHGSPGNIVPICRFLNCIDHSDDANANNRTANGDGMSKRKLAQMLLLTDLIEITDAERAKITAWLEDNKPSFKRQREEDDDE